MYIYIYIISFIVIVFRFYPSSSSLTSTIINLLNCEYFFSFLFFIQLAIRKFYSSIYFFFLFKFCGTTYIYMYTCDRRFYMLMCVCSSKERTENKKWRNQNLKYQQLQSIYCQIYMFYSNEYIVYRLVNFNEDIIEI